MQRLSWKDIFKLTHKRENKTSEFYVEYMIFIAFFLIVVPDLDLRNLYGYIAPIGFTLIVHALIRIWAYSNTRSKLQSLYQDPAVYKRGLKHFILVSESISLLFYAVWFAFYIYVYF